MQKRTIDTQKPGPDSGASDASIRDLMQGSIVWLTRFRAGNTGKSRERLR